MITELWGCLVGLGLTSALVQYLLFFLAFPTVLKKTTGKNWNLKYLPFMVLGLCIFLGTFPVGLQLFSFLNLNDMARKDQAGYLMWPTLFSGAVMMWGVVRCVKFREEYKKGEWEKNSATKGIPEKISVLTEKSSVLITKITKRIPCPGCLEDIDGESCICEKCGYPFSKSLVPRSVKLRWSRPLWFLLLVSVLVPASVDFRARRAFPIILTKYRGTATNATITEVHCDFSKAVKDWLRNKIWCKFRQGVELAAAA